MYGLRVEWSPSIDNLLVVGYYEIILYQKKDVEYKMVSKIAQLKLADRSLRDAQVFWNRNYILMGDWFGHVFKLSISPINSS